jgi:retinol dehydrogenase 12
MYAFTRISYSSLLRELIAGSFAAIKETTECSTIECWTVDLANFKSISAFVDRFDREGGDRLDILLENAGILSNKFHSTVDGWEAT